MDRAAVLTLEFHHSQSVSRGLLNVPSGCRPGDERAYRANRYDTLLLFISYRR